MDLFEASSEKILPQLVQVRGRLVTLMTFYKIRKDIVSMKKPLIILSFLKRNFQLKLGKCLHISLSMSKIKKNSFYMYRKVLGGVWVMEIIEI